VWEVVDERLRWMWRIHADMVRSLAFSPDSRRLAIGSVDGMIQIWDVASSALLWSNWHTNNVTALAFSPGNWLLASGGYDGKVILWDIVNGAIYQMLAGQTDRILRLVWSPNGQLIASSGWDRVIQLRDLTAETREEIQEPKTIFLWVGLEPGWEAPGLWYLFAWHPGMVTEYEDPQMDGE
jgi:WD40 repeat protein